MSAVHPLDRKLVRELWRLRGQVIAIALVIGSGVGLLVMALTTQDALRTTAEAYYERYRFADVFAKAKRAPESLAERLGAIEGVQTVETRIVDAAILDIEGFEEPVVGLIVSIPEAEQPRLNQLVLRSGRLVEANAPDEVVLNEPFAAEHGFRLGDTFGAILNGKKRSLRIVGTALSPEFAYALGPGSLMPDDERYGVMWMGREALAAAFDLEDAFNDVTLAVGAAGDQRAVVAHVDRLLGPYGGADAIGRDDQLSNWFLMNELRELQTMAVVLPVIFLTVAAFLTNMVTGRLIATERASIGLLKAFGYSNLAIAAHYAKMVVAMAMTGVLLGWAVGAALGRYNTAIYAEHFTFPFLIYRPGPESFLTAAAVSLTAALGGAALAVRAAIRLAPAEAMRPPAPASFAQNAALATRIGAAFDQPSRMIVRHTTRWPVRSAITVLGIAMSIAVMISSLQWLDALDELVDLHFFATQRNDATVGLVEVQSADVLASFLAMPGVRAAEGERSVRAKIRAGLREERVSLSGRDGEPRLSLVYDAQTGAIPVAGAGLTMSTKLAEMLDVGLGDRVMVEVLEGPRPIVELPVSRLFETLIEFPVYMNIKALNALMREAPSVNAVHLSLDSNLRAAFFAALKETPRVSGLFMRQNAVDLFDKTVGETIAIFIGFFSTFSVALSLGVVYNAARIALSERARELATLRVLGFTRGETAYILLGQALLLVVIALPFGCLAGYWLSALMSSTFDTELFRIPLTIAPATYGWSIVTSLASASIASLIIWRQVVGLDLVAVLKTRD